MKRERSLPERSLKQTLNLLNLNAHEYKEMLSAAHNRHGINRLCTGLHRFQQNLCTLLSCILPRVFKGLEQVHSFSGVFRINTFLEKNKTKLNIEFKIYFIYKIRIGFFYLL